MILQPEFIGPDRWRPRSTRCEKKNPVALDRVRLRRWRRELPRRFSTWAVCRRGPDDSRIHDFIHAAGKELAEASRDLSERSAKDRAGEVEDVIRQPMK